MAQNVIQTINLFDQADNRYRTQRSGMTPGALQPGEVTQSTNLRYVDGTMTVRGGIVSDYATTGLGSGVIVGGVRNYLGSWVAVNVSGTVKVYQWGGSSWSEITDGTTRTTVTDPIEFEFITEPIYSDVADFDDTNNVYVVWQNGVDIPRIRNATAGGSYSSRLHQRLTEPLPSMCKAQFVPVQYFLTQGTLTRANDGSGHVAFTAPSVSTGGTNLLLTCDTSATTSHYATVRFDSGSISFSSSPSQAQFVYKSSDSFIWSKLRVELVTNAGTRYVILDPSLNTFVKTVTIDDVYSMVVIDIDTVYDSSLALVTTGLPTSTNFNMLRISWADSSSPSSSTTLNLYSITFGMGVPYGVQAKVAYFGSNSRSESRGVVCQTQAMPLLKDVGGTPIPNIRLAASPLASYRLKVLAHKRRSISQNATRLITYIQTSSGDDFYQVLADPTDISGMSDSEVITVNVDSTSTILRLSPDEKYESLPIGSGMAIAGTRLAVGNARPPGSSATSGNGQVWVSERNYMTRFSEVVRTTSTGEPIGDSATVYRIANAQITAIKTMPSINYGAEAVLAWSTTKVWSIGVADSSKSDEPKLQSEYGTRSPGSIATHMGQTFYLDTYRQVRILGGGMTGASPSATYIDDKLAGIPDARVKYVSAVFHDDRYYLAYTPSGSSYNENLLIYDKRYAGWSMDSTSASVKFEILLAVEENTKRKLFFFDTSGGIYQHENSSQATDAGTAITMAVTFRELFANYMSSVVVGRVGVVCDVQSGKTLSVYRNAKKSTTSATASTIDIGGNTTGSNIVTRWDRSASDASQIAGRGDAGIAVRITGALPSGTRIYQVMVEWRISGSIIDTA